MKKQKLWHVLTILMGTALFLTGCSFFKSSRTLDTSEAPINQLVPNTEVTLESKIESAEDMRSFVQSSYDKMQELAAEDNASPDGIDAAKKVEEEYSERIEELAALDFSAMNENEIDTLLIEMTNLITPIREARDALSLSK